jgi:hypothetical protein
MRHTEPPPLRLPRAERSYGRAISVSAGIHAAVLLVLVWVAARVESRPAPSAAGPGPLGGAGGVRYVELPAYRVPQRWGVERAVRQPATPTPKPQVREPAPAVSVEDVARVSLVAVHEGELRDLSGAGSGKGGGVGYGTGLGTGDGRGPGGGGADDGIFPPQARYSILPPLPRPGSVRGKRFEVRFWVDATGRVTRVAVRPAISDAEYRKQFVQLMLQYTFTPALRPDGTPVAGETVLTITL